MSGYFRSRPKTRPSYLSNSVCYSAFRDRRCYCFELLLLSPTGSAFVSESSRRLREAEFIDNQFTVKKKSTELASNFFFGCGGLGRAKSPRRHPLPELPDPIRAARIVTPNPAVRLRQATPTTAPEPHPPPRWEQMRGRSMPASTRRASGKLDHQATI